MSSRWQPCWTRHHSPAALFLLSQLGIMWAAQAKRKTWKVGLTTVASLVFEGGLWATLANGSYLHALLWSINSPQAAGSGPVAFITVTMFVLPLLTSVILLMNSSKVSSKLRLWIILAVLVEIAFWAYVAFLWFAAVYSIHGVQWAVGGHSVMKLPFPEAQYLSSQVFFGITFGDIVIRPMGSGFAPITEMFSLETLLSHIYWSVVVASVLAAGWSWIGGPQKEKQDS